MFKKLKLNKNILNKKRKIDKWIIKKHQIDILEKEIEMAEHGDVYQGEHSKKTQKK